MKIRFYIFGIVCVFLTCSFASAEWARFSDYENNGGCGFDTCDTDADCNAGQCHFCDLSSGTNGHGICKKGSTYDGKDYDTYEKCKCVSRKREWATTENKCCPKGEYNSDGHCCKKDNNDDTKTEIWCETAQKCQSKKESCCSDAKDGTDVNGTMTEACCKAANGSWSNATCCSTAKDGKDIQGTFTEACCKAANGTWEDNKCSFNKCADGEYWDTSDEAKNYTGNSYTHVSGVGACCPETYWNKTYKVCCYGPYSRWTNKRTGTCAKLDCEAQQDDAYFTYHWDTSQNAKDSTYGTTEGACCNTWNKSANECCSTSHPTQNAWSYQRTTGCAKADCISKGYVWDTSAGAKKAEDGTSEGACCSNWINGECCSGEWNHWDGSKISTNCCINNYNHSKIPNSGRVCHTDYNDAVCISSRDSCADFGWHQMCTLVLE